MSTYNQALMDYLHKMQVASGMNPNWRPQPVVAPMQTQAPSGGGLAGIAKSIATKKLIDQVGAQKATEAVAPGVTPGIGIAPYLGAAGAALGAAGIYGATQMKDKKSAGLAGGLSGAGMGAGIGMAAPLVGLGPVGWGALGLMALGGGALGGGLGAGLAGKSTGEIQAERWGKVGRENANPEGYDYFAGTGGEQSRDESLLTANAIRNNPDNYTAAADWDSWSKEHQDKLLSTLLSEKKVNERKGGIYYDDARAKQLADEIRGTFAPVDPAQMTAADRYSSALQKYLAAAGVK